MFCLLWVNDKYLSFLEFLILGHALSSLRPLLATGSLHDMAFATFHSHLRNLPAQK